MRLRSARLLLVAALSLGVLAGTAGCSQDRSRLIGTWHCKPDSSAAFDYTFSSDGTYREDYVRPADDPASAITGTWTLSSTTDSRPALSLKAKEDPCAGGLLPYHFVSDDELVVDGVALVRRR